MAGPFDQGKVLTTRELGYEEDFEIQLQRNHEGGWVATCPKTGIAETGETRDEAIHHLIANLKLHKRQPNG
ncbi:MAG: hypothetical protein ABI743_06880 [bacterium]